MNQQSLFPPNFTLAQFRFTLEALDPLFLPPVKSSALRGGFGHTMKRLACTRPGQCDQACRLGNSCAYGYVFETTPPADTEVLRTFSDIPRPFIIHSPTDRRTHIPPGDRMIFGLTLVGGGIAFLPHFVAVFVEMGHVGLGRERGQYRLLEVEAVSPGAKKNQLIYRAGDSVVRVPSTIILTEQLTEIHTSSLSNESLTLNLLTPTRLKHRGQWINEGPPFQALIKVLLSRTSSLSYFHCGERMHVDFRGLIDRAAQVKIAERNTRWEDWSRVSGRQKQRVEMGGLVGRVTYEGDLTDYLPLLALGEFIHVGKGTVFGNGQYEIVK